MTAIKEFEEKPYATLAVHSRKLAAEGCVLLKNENNVLPKKWCRFSAERRLTT